MHFEKVSLNRFAKDISVKNVDGNTLQRWHGGLKLPQQGSEHSAGCDFFMPYPVSILPHNEIRIVTGIRFVPDCDEDFNYYLQIVPRSGLGCKHGLKLKNTVGVIDSDYAGSDNEGHIIVTLVNPSDNTIELGMGQAFVQGIITPYKIPTGAESTTTRNGGFGSSDNMSGHV